MAISFAFVCGCVVIVVVIDVILVMRFLLCVVESVVSLLFVGGGVEGREVEGEAVAGEDKVGDRMEGFERVETDVAGRGL